MDFQLWAGFKTENQVFLGSVVVIRGEKWRKHYHRQQKKVK